MVTLEIEVKAYADDLKSVEENLKKMGAHLLEVVHEIDTYFNHPNRNFAETDEALRIRASDGHTFLTYKGKKVDPKSITREEIEVALGGVNPAQQLLEKLGFNQVADVEKVRKKYELGEFTICLDDVKGIGTFVEVEVNPTGELFEELRNRVITLLEDLNLKKYERKSYLELLLEKQGNSGISTDSGL